MENTAGPGRPAGGAWRRVAREGLQEHHYPRPPPRAVSSKLQVSNIPGPALPGARIFKTSITLGHSGKRVLKRSAFSQSGAPG